MKDRHYFELATPGSSIRLCQNLEKTFPDLRGAQLQLLKRLCLTAFGSQGHLPVHFNNRDAWLRTTIFLNPVDGPHHVFSAQGTECREIARIMSLNGDVREYEYGRLMQRLVLPEITSKIEIRSNILPPGAYLERLQELQRLSCWMKLQTMLTLGTYWYFGRGFFPKTILDQACEAGNVSLLEKLNEWRRNGGRCDLAMHLQSRDFPQRRPPRLVANVGLQDVSIAELEVVLRLGEGNGGTVDKVLWRNGTYAMKETASAKREYDVALRVSNPHTVMVFGFCVNDVHSDEDEPDQGDCLLMEMMADDLFRLAVNHDTCVNKPPFSPMDSLDILLQVGRAVGCMHSNGVVHGDLKPHNILISQFEIFGNMYFVAKVADFGCAQFITPGQSLRIRDGIGTNAYAAPEVLTREREFEHPEKMDVYSFGSVAYEVLTGHAVYDFPLKRSHMDRIIAGELRPSESEVWKNLVKKHRYPLELIKLVENCWNLRPEDRPPFPNICSTIEECKFAIRRWEERRAAVWCIFVILCLLGIIFSLLFQSMKFVSILPF